MRENLKTSRLLQNRQNSKMRNYYGKWYLKPQDFIKSFKSVKDKVEMKAVEKVQARQELSFIKQH